MHAHAWSRWIRGRHTALWFRHCASCPAVEQATEQPPDQVRPRGLPDAREGEELIPIRDRMARFSRPSMRQHVWSNVVDFRAKQAGDA